MRDTGTIVITIVWYRYTLTLTLRSMYCLLTCTAAIIYTLNMSEHLSIIMTYSCILTTMYIVIIQLQHTCMTQHNTQLLQVALQEQVMLQGREILQLALWFQYRLS